MRIGLSLVGQTSQLVDTGIILPTNPIVDLITSLGGTVVYIDSIASNAFIDFNGSIRSNQNEPIGKVTHNNSTVAYQSEPARKPLSLRNLNDSNVISFDGVDDYLQTNILTLNSGWFCAGVTYNNINHQALISTGAGYPTEKGVLATLYSMSSTQARLFAQVGNGTEVLQANTIIPIGEYCVVSMGWDNQSVYAGLGLTESSKVTLTGDFTGTSEMTIGIHRNLTSFPLHGNVTAVVYLPSVPTAENKQTIINWLSNL